MTRLNDQGPAALVLLLAFLSPGGEERLNKGSGFRGHAAFHLGSEQDCLLTVENELENHLEHEME